MHISNINDAKTHLSKLVNLALAGEEIVIARSNQPLVKLTPYQQDTSPRIGGFWKDQVIFREGWDETDVDLIEMFENSNILPGEDA